MSTPHAPLPVKLFVAILAQTSKLLLQAQRALVPEMGQVELQSSVWPFVETDYYRPEMGSGLVRTIVAFRRLIMPDRLAWAKHCAIKCEQQLAVIRTGCRRVNLDPGYLDAAKVVLASTKDFTHRLYLGQGIYGEVTLRYTRGEGYQPWPWTYPDYGSAAYRAFFERVRRQYRTQLKRGHRLKPETRISQ